MKTTFFSVLLTMISLSASKQFAMSQYSGDYSSNWSCPRYVVYSLTAKNVTDAAAAPRPNSNFVKNDSLGTLHPDDYTGSGFDRGHMVPAEDMEFTVLSGKESFNMANICPQFPGLNRGPWKVLEKNVRDSILKYGSGKIWTGPFGSFVTVGKLKIFPYFFKIAKFNGRYYSWVWSNEKRPIQLSISLDSIKKITGVNLPYPKG